MATYPAPSPTYVGPPAHYTQGMNKPITRIVLHGTVSPTIKGGARATAAYFKEDRAGGSAHYVVDPGEVIQAAYDSVICWHAPPNPNSLGVEFTDWVGTKESNRRLPLPLSRWDDTDHRTMLLLAARLVAQLCLAYNIPMVMLSAKDLKAGKKGICEHSDVSKAWGQSSHWDLGNFPRLRFIKMVRAEAAKIVAAAAVPAPVPLKPTRVTQVRELLTEAARITKSKSRRNRLLRALKELPLR